MSILPTFNLLSYVIITHFSPLTQDLLINKPKYYTLKGKRVTINRDFNANDKAEEDDAEVSKATVSLLLTNLTTGQQWTGTGDTNGSGQVTFLLRRAPSGKYKSEVTNLTHATYTWNPALDVANPAYYTL